MEYSLQGFGGSLAIGEYIYFSLYHNMISARRKKYMAVVTIFAGYVGTYHMSCLARMTHTL